MHVIAYLLREAWGPCLCIVLGFAPSVYEWIPSFYSFWLSLGHRLKEPSQRQRGHWLGTACHHILLHQYFRMLCFYVFCQLSWSDALNFTHQIVIHCQVVIDRLRGHIYWPRDFSPKTFAKRSLNSSAQAPFDSYRSCLCRYFEILC